MNYLHHNEAIVKEKDFYFSSQSRAFQYGDGVYETIRFHEHQLWFFEDHCARLKKAVQALALDPDPLFLSPAYLYDSILDLIEENQSTHLTLRIKVIIYRDSKGLYTPNENTASLVIIATPVFPIFPKEKELVYIFDEIRLQPSVFSPYKTLSALPYVMAGVNKQRLQADDLILLDTQGYLSECIASNIFWIKGHMIFSPSIQSGCKEGIIWQQIRRQNEFNFQEGLFLPEHLYDAEAVGCCNSFGIQHVLRIGEHSFNKHPFIDALQNEWFS